ncbi:MAG: WbqC family protein [Gemmatimonadetes bacterium]|nr:WbqC family protein [Gemmatimonadota bacterium]
MPDSRVVAIHQPNFLPWLGWFDKLARADVFVLMDNTQFPRTSSGTWVNRVRMLVGGGPGWVTVPVARAGRGLRMIHEMEIDDSSRWRDKLLRTLQASYGRAPHFGEVFPPLSEWIGNPTASLAEFNTAAIHGVAGLLGLDTGKLVRGSTLQAEGAATELLIGMTRAAGGTAYLCGGGAEGYQEDEKFSAAGVELVYQGFVPAPYPQGRAPEFVPGLSVVDALMWCGPAGTRALLGGQGRPAGGAG